MILDKNRELEWSEKNRARDNTLIVYTATPEEIEKLKGVSDMGRPPGSKNKKNNSGIEILRNDKKAFKSLNERREELAKKLEAKKEEEKHEMNEADVIDLLKAVVEAPPLLLHDGPLLLNHDAGQVIPPEKIELVLEGSGPVVDNVIVNEYHRTLINKIRKAAYEAYVEEIASLYTGMDAENMIEKISNIIDISATTLMEIKERGL